MDNQNNNDEECHEIMEKCVDVVLDEQVPIVEVVYPLGTTSAISPEAEPLSQSAVAC